MVLLFIARIFHDIHGLARFFSISVLSFARPIIITIICIIKYYGCLIEFYFSFQIDAAPNVRLFLVREGHWWHFVYYHFDYQKVKKMLRPQVCFHFCVRHICDKPWLNIRMTATRGQRKIHGDWNRGCIIELNAYMTRTCFLMTNVPASIRTAIILV